MGQIVNSYSVMLEERVCQGGCGLTFKVMPTSTQNYARSNCADYCKTNKDVQANPNPPPDRRQAPRSHTRVSVEGLRQAEAKAPPPPEIKPEKEPVNVEPEIEVDYQVSVKKTTNDSLIVDKIDSHLKIFWGTCITEAKKMLTRKPDLKAKMGVAYCALAAVATYKEQQTSLGIKAFAREINLTPNELDAWIKVRQLVWEKSSNLEQLERFSFDDLVVASAGLRPETPKSAVNKIIEDQIFKKYENSISLHKTGLISMRHFFEKYTLDLLPEAEFDEIHRNLKMVSGKFRDFAVKKKREKIKVL